MNSELYLQLQHVIDALAADLYHPVGGIPLRGFKAEKDLSLEEASVLPRQDFPEGSAWGMPGDYVWMFSDFILPAEAEGERIVMDLNPGGEATLFVDGQPFGTRRADRLAHPHHYIVDQTVRLSGKAGETVRLAMEVYGGTPLPADPGRPVFPEDGIRFIRTGAAVTGHSTFGFWNEEAYQLWLDLDMLKAVHDFLDENDCFKEKMTLYIGKMLDALDMEIPLPERRAAYVRAREIIAPLMAARNGTFAPSMGVIGNSHLDYAWLWTDDETRRKTARTFAAQLRLLEEYPESVFLQSQCAEYELCRQYYPDLFEKVREAIRQGRWIADGGMWVEPDTNLAGGEALIRQFLYGKKYFREVLGVESRVAWLPDTFGYSAALPQIIRKFNMQGLTTQKIFWSYNESESFPHHAFRWKGLDGSEISCYLHMFYETQVDAATLHTRWNARVERDGSGDFYLPFGYGDGGGGPTRDDMEQIRRQKDLQGCPRLYWATPYDYLKKREEDVLPVYRGELYFPCHRGTYTTQSAVKKLNRAAEDAMRSWEMLAAAAAYAGKADYPGEAIEATWKILLTNQFHDILPGSAIGPVYVKARKQLAEAIGTAREGARKALGAFRTGESGTTVFNPAGHASFRTAETENGPVNVSVPALGAALLKPAGSFGGARAFRDRDGYVLENNRFTARLNERGELLSLVTKADGKERVRNVSNRLHLYRDLPRKFDAWDIDSQTLQRETFPETACGSVIEIAEGSRAAVRFTLRFGASVLEQTVSLGENGDRIDFDTRADWQERHRLLKVSFDTGIEADNASHQVQFGYIDRPTHRSRRYDMDRFEVCNHAFTALYDATHGAAVLNDCKYGVSAEDGVISLSLLRSPTYPDANADRGENSFRYAYFVWDGSFRDSGILAQAEDMNLRPVLADGTCELPPVLSFSSPSVTAESVKLAEDGSGDLIARLYENSRGTADVTVSFPFPCSRVSVCDLEENRLRELPFENGSVTVGFTPFEIVTLRFAK